MSESAEAMAEIQQQISDVVENVRVSVPESSKKTVNSDSKEREREMKALSSGNSTETG